VISLTLTAGTATPLTINDSGRSGYVLTALNPGRIDRDNTYAESRWMDGAALVSSRTTLTALDVGVQVWGTSLADLFSKVTTFGSVVGNDAYTVTAAYSGGSTVYTAMPASYSVEYDPSLLRNFMAVITASIPRQP
jgi:hypothetical protein